MSTVKVAPSPDVGTAVEVKIKPLDNSSSQDESNHSAGENINAEVVSRKSTKASTKASLATETRSQKQKKYNSSRTKSSSSYFTERNDVFEIEEHVEKLSTHLEKQYRVQSSKNNQWTARRSYVERFFKGSCFRAPRLFSCDEICQYSKVGDVLLFREGSSFENQYLSPEVMRGIRSSLDGKYIPKNRSIKMWNNAAIVVSLCHEDSGELLKYALYADRTGLRIRKLSELTNSCNLSRNLCALRPLKIKNDKHRELYADLVDDLESVALLSMDGKLLWTNFAQAFSCVNGNRSNNEEDFSLILDNPILMRFYKNFIDRMQRFAYFPSQEGVQEATRLFYSILAIYLENCKNNKSSDSKTDGRSNFSSKSSFEKSEQPLPLDFIHKSLSVMNDEKGESMNSDIEFTTRLRSLLQNMDDDNDGHVSLGEFIEAFLSNKCSVVPIEFDLLSVANGEAVACLYAALGIFKEDALPSSSFFHPQTFSSSSSYEINAARAETKNLKSVQAVPFISKDMLNYPRKTKFKRDILLRLK